MIVNRITPWTDLGHALSLGVLVAIMAPLGDLCESLLKRDLKIKDFGTLLPGHGGVLDRFDAILFCLPAVLLPRPVPEDRLRATARGATSPPHVGA